MEAGGGIEPPHSGFANRCITTLLPSLASGMPAITRASASVKPPSAFPCHPDGCHHAMV